MITYNLEPSGAVCIRDGYDNPMYFNEESLRAAIATAIATIEKNRHEYTTKEAWQRNLTMYKNALAYFPSEEKRSAE